MSIKDIKDPTIAKEKYKWSHEVKNKLDYTLWIDFVDKNHDYFSWWENTEDGRKTSSAINEVPVDFREGVLLKLQKQQALAEFNQRKGWYEVIVDFHRELGIIHTTFQKPITKAHLHRLLDMANYLDAYLLNNGNEIIDEKVIETYYGTSRS